MACMHLDESMTPVVRQDILMDRTLSVIKPASQRQYPVQKPCSPAAADATYGPAVAGLAD